MTNWRILLVIFAAVVLLFSGNDCFAGDDVHLVNCYTVKYKINDKFDVFVNPTMRRRDDMSELSHYYFREGVIMHAFENLDLGSTYRFSRAKNNSDAWSSNEHRLELDITPKVKLGDFSLCNRSRFEHRWLASSDNRWRYRNFTKIAYPGGITGFSLIPYASEEFYYDFKVEKINVNWATFGLDKKVTDHLTIGLFYRNETSRVGGAKDEWDATHVLGTKGVLSF
jgi:hypothetical protein